MKKKIGREWGETRIWNKICIRPILPSNGFKTVRKHNILYYKLFIFNLVNQIINNLKISNLIFSTRMLFTTLQSSNHWPQNLKNAKRFKRLNLKKWQNKCYTNVIQYILTFFNDFFLLNLFALNFEKNWRERRRVTQIVNKIWICLSAINIRLANLNIFKRSNILFCCILFCQGNSKTHKNQ